MKLYGLLLLMLLTACSTSVIENEANDSALCEGLREPIDTFVDVIIREQKNTPDEVIIKGTRVVKGYDSVC